LPSRQSFTPPFPPICCAEVVFSAESGEEWRSAVTWVGIVLGDTPRLCATLMTPPDRQTLPILSNFSVRFPSVDLPPGQSDGSRHDQVHSCHSSVDMQCHAGTPQLEHGRFLLCGDIAAVQVEDTPAPWLRPLLRTSHQAVTKTTATSL
jgi:hypothetical protein